MDTVGLSPDLERFAAEAIATGQYRDMADLVAAGVALLQRADAERRSFIQSLDGAIAEGERDGFFELDAVLAEVDAIIEDEARAGR